MGQCIESSACKTAEHWNRRSILKLAGASGISWLTPMATQLARAAEKAEDRRAPAKSLIVLWLEGAPSQLETFDPHPGTEIAAGSTSRSTRVRGIELGSALEQTAEQMDSISLVRSLYSKEGDHERAIYNIKTGYRPDPTLKHPSLGSIVCHHYNSVDRGVVDIPRHVSIIPGGFPARGGFLGDPFDAFQVGDPTQPVPDVAARVDDQRFRSRVNDLENFVDRRFRRGRIQQMDGGRTLGEHTLQSALKMMSSDQLRAFDISSVPKARKAAYGDTAFGRSCLAALQLIQAGVRCVEITLTGWDSHANNHQIQESLIKVLDPAFATLIRELKAQELLDSTVVMCGGEFGRTPFMNNVGGRDHWPHGFSVALAGGGIAGGRVIGETSPTPRRESDDRLQELVEPHPVEDIHATVMQALGVNIDHEFDTPIGRPMAVTEGSPIRKLLEA